MSGPMLKRQRMETALQPILAHWQANVAMDAEVEDALQKAAAALAVVVGLQEEAERVKAQHEAQLGSVKARHAEEVKRVMAQLGAKVGRAEALKAVIMQHGWELKSVKARHHVELDRVTAPAAQQAAEAKRAKAQHEAQLKEAHEKIAKLSAERDAARKALKTLSAAAAAAAAAVAAAEAARLRREGGGEEGRATAGRACTPDSVRASPLSHELARPLSTRAKANGGVECVAGVGGGLRVYVVERGGGRLQLHIMKRGGGRGRGGGGGGKARVDHRRELLVGAAQTRVTFSRFLFFFLSLWLLLLSIVFFFKSQNVISFFQLCPPSTLSI